MTQHDNEITYIDIYKYLYVMKQSDICNQVNNNKRKIFQAS